jgi:chorismate mutase
MSDSVNHRGNIVKYVARAPHKGNELQDLKKARWYLDRLIEQLEARKEPEEEPLAEDNSDEAIAL